MSPAPSLCPTCGSQLEPIPGSTDTLHCPRCEAAETVAATAVWQPSHTTGAAAPRAVTRVPGFDVLGEIGRGGMGIVYRAVQLSLGREVAIKVLPPTLSSEDYRLDRLKNEATIAASLTRTHILPLFDVVEVDSSPALVMPFIDGTDLGKVLKQRKARRKGPVPPDHVHSWAALSDRDFVAAVLPVLDQLIEAVAAMHESGVLHRDIKPSNMLIDRRASLWLSDFGLARLMEDTADLPSGTHIGTRGYMSPEQVRGDQVDYRSDIFCVGVTLYHVLTLELPYGAAYVGRGFQAPIPPSRRSGTLSRDFDAVVLKALAIEPDDRYQTATELAADWRRARAGELPEARKMGRAARLARGIGRRKWATAALLFLALAAAAWGWSLVPTPKPVRDVLIQTSPAGARIVCVPLDPDTGRPKPEEAIRPAAGKLSPVQLRLPSGDYLIEAEVENYGFHEVFRHVPEPREIGSGTLYPHMFWTITGAGVVAEPTIVIPESDGFEGMAYFEGNDQFVVGSAAMANMLPPHTVSVSPFYLETTETTVGRYEEESQGLPNELASLKPARTEPVRFVSWDDAIAFAERIGKRLPTEEECEFVGTNGGLTKYPWGNAAPPMPWRLGEAGVSTFDFTPGEPKVFNLYSNVVEWTSSWYHSYPGTPVTAILPEVRTARIVRGGHYFIVTGQWAKTGPPGGPRWREGITRSARHPGLGFRCARSAAPRFLDDE